jgi:hypothetical protein
LELLLDFGFVGGFVGGFDILVCLDFSNLIDVVGATFDVGGVDFLVELVTCVLVSVSDSASLLLLLLLSLSLSLPEDEDIMECLPFVCFFVKIDSQTKGLKVEIPFVSSL